MTRRVPLALPVFWGLVSNSLAEPVAHTFQNTFLAERSVAQELRLRSDVAGGRKRTSAGRLPHDVRRQVDIQITPPSLRVRDQVRECQVERIAYEKGLLSPQTWSLRLGLDYDQEQKNLAMHGAG